MFRLDCYETLRLKPEQLFAVRRLEQEIATRFRAEGRDSMSESIDGSGSVEHVTVRSLDAARRIEAVLALLDQPWKAQLLLKLSTPAVCEGATVNWKAIVRQMLGVIDRDIQARKVKAAAEGLRLAWIDHDNGQVRRAA